MKGKDYQGAVLVPPRGCLSLECLRITSGTQHPELKGAVTCPQRDLWAESGFQAPQRFLRPVLMEAGQRFAVRGDKAFVVDQVPEHFPV